MLGLGRLKSPDSEHAVMVCWSCLVPASAGSKNQLLNSKEFCHPVIKQSLLKIKLYKLTKSIIQNKD